MVGMRWGTVASGCLALVIAAMLVTGCGSEGGSPLGPNAIKTADPVKTFAPLISLHPKERLLGLSAEAFIASSSLWWMDRGCRDVKLASEQPGGGLPAVSPARLGGDRPYRHVARRPPDCHRAKKFATSDYTRPLDPSRANDIEIDEGFYLDLADDERSGVDPVAGANGTRSIDVPVYFERDVTHRGDDQMVRLTYWFLLASERRPGPRRAGATAFEGDWRWARVLLRSREGTDAYVPLGVRLGVRYSYLPWRSVRLAAGAGPRTHPTVFVARGSHALFPKPGSYDRDIQFHDGTLHLKEDATECPNCIAWRAWQDVRDARKRPWHGYGGGWGEALGLLPSGLGPSRWGDLTKDVLLRPGFTD